MWINRCGKRIVAEVGLDELALVVAVALLTVALWPLAGRLTLAIPGAVLLWVALPTRAPFIVRPAAPDKHGRKD